MSHYFNMNGMTRFALSRIIRRNIVSANGPGALVLIITVVFLAMILAQARPTSINADRLGTTSGAELTLDEAYFKFDYPPYPETFILRLTDPEKIQEARNILGGWSQPRHVKGTIVKEPHAYNPLWSYHLDPASIEFFDFATEICDATIREVEERLDEACGAFLPDCVWCPWGSRLIAEVNLAYLPIVLRDY